MELWVATAVIGVYPSKSDALAACDRFIARAKIEHPVRTDDPDAYYVSDVERVLLGVDGVQPG